MALEPAIGDLVGLLVVHQKPSTPQLIGILLVVLAGAGAQRGGRRQPRAVERNLPHSELELSARPQHSQPMPARSEPCT